MKHDARWELQQMIDAPSSGDFGVSACLRFVALQRRIETEEREKAMQQNTFTFSRGSGSVTVTFEPETRFAGYSFMVVIRADYTGQILARDWMISAYAEPSQKAAAFFVAKHQDAAQLERQYPERNAHSGTDQIVGYSDIYGDAICLDCDEARGGNIGDHEVVLLLRHAFEDLGYHCTFCGQVFPDGYGLDARESER